MNSDAPTSRQLAFIETLKRTRPAEVRESMVEILKDPFGAAHAAVFAEMVAALPAPATTHEASEQIEFLRKGRNPELTERVRTRMQAQFQAEANARPAGPPNAMGRRALPPRRSQQG